MRIENRISGSDTNPYLVIAANLAAGYLGIKNKLNIKSLADPEQASIVHVTNGGFNR